MKEIMSFGYVMLCSLVKIYQYVKQIYCFYMQGKEYHFTLKMEVVSSSKTLVSATLHGDTTQMTIIFVISTIRA